MRVFVLVLAVLLTFGCQKKDDLSQSSQTEKPSASQTPPAVTEQTGKFVINPQFDSASYNFSEGLLEPLHIANVPHVVASIAENPSETCGTSCDGGAGAAATA